MCKIDEATYQAFRRRHNQEIEKQIFSNYSFDLRRSNFTYNDTALLEQKNGTCLFPILLHMWHLTFSPKNTSLRSFQFRR